MRTTLDIPDAVFRETKALAAKQGISMEQFILDAIELAKKTPPGGTVPDQTRQAVRKFPSFHLKSGRKLSVQDFGFDDLLA